MSWVASIHLIGYSAFVLALSLQTIIFCVLYKPHSKYFFYIPALWVFSELIRSYILGGFAWTIGNAQAFNPQVISMAGVTGSYGVSFIIILINSILYQIIFIKKKPFYYLGISFLIFILAGGYSFYVFKGQSKIKDKIILCTIQPNISTRDKNNGALIDKLFDRQMQLSYQCLDNKKPDLIIWPETAVTDDVIRDEIIHQKIIHFVKKVQVPLLVGSALLIDNKNFNSAVLFDKMGKVKQIYHKNKLVPFTEKVFQFGKKIGVFHLSKNKNFGVTICSEDGYPKIFKKLVKEQLNFIIVLLNDAWFNQEAGLMMHLQNAVMRSVEFGIPIVRSANTGWSGYINSVGQIQNKDKNLNTVNVLKIEIDSIPRETFYARFGDVFAMLCGFFVILKNIKLKNENL